MVKYKYCTQQNGKYKSKYSTYCTKVYKHSSTRVLEPTPDHDTLLIITGGNQR